MKNNKRIFGKATTFDGWRRQPTHDVRVGTMKTFCGVLRGSCHFKTEKYG